MGKARWIIFTAIVVLVLGGLVVYSKMNSTSVDVSEVNQNTTLTGSDKSGNIGDHVYNDTKSEVVLVEYGDFQCPGCGAAHPNVKTLLEEYGDKISFVFRNFPLTSIHPNARAAAAAAEAAGLQGKYWEMHDTLFESQSAWQSLDGTKRTDMFVSYARSLDLDVERFKTDYAGEQVSQKISFDQELGKKAGASATPTFVLDGEILPDDVSNGILQGDLDGIKKLLDEKLQ